MILNNKLKKVCVVVNSRANYARVKSLLLSINKSKRLKLILVGVVITQTEKKM